MIPKVIHYCWFGGNPLPELAIKCIESWKKYLPSYEIREWNEQNFNLECCDYVKEAYKAQKWAFVSDYARFEILYEYGGIYFDTDVELINSMDDILDEGPFMGCEQTNKGMPTVNSGLGIAADKNMRIYREILEDYHNSHFFNEKPITVVERVTTILEKYGYTRNDVKQTICGITIYPSEYFCPLNYFSGEMLLTNNSKSIHHYSMSWQSPFSIFLKKYQMRCKKVFGKYIGQFIYLISSIPVRIVRKIYLVIFAKN